MRIKVGLILIGVMILVVGCNLANIIDSSPAIYKADQELKGDWFKKDLPQNGKYKLITAKNKEELLNDWSLEKNKPYYQELKETDLSNRVAILAYLGEMPSGGYGIQIDKVAKKDDKVLVKVKRVSPSPDDMVTMVITYPYDLITIDKDKFGSAEISKLDLVVVNQDGEVLNK
ncbi:MULTISPECIES: protease complex subunit PrcB family protein [unclassified Candidatus Frackibacter]|uniref:protease complex subunit PrcB family protein n=1 Tax=unclassified Candidatus Frackibacter TaxID=2648818 RepID=UPI00079CB22A|nr:MULTISPECIES: protease complex subunit PrcB family protein [unclassified Candidatus Frackibacter]KXS38413.1 MAG: hypothetical protein AWU54_2217 [Candidatus Frackibacter sp. T328-2]SDC80292.1 PrcB C-terminal [Candidatus Frackibacter sp. WG11]SEM92815.1 PrcB C-terminal [Candidatus Frackibacter sp. WG12]SFM03124.1 PrcB C-terminal [Candidatus Frackibacter sp. WG13]